MLRKPMTQTAVLLTLLAALAWMTGCRAHFGPGPRVSASFAMSTYTHGETTTQLLCTAESATLLDVSANGDSADVSANGDSQKLYVCEQTTWTTDVARPYGTSGNEYYIDTQQESGSITGKGISSNLSGVIGEDVGGRAAELVIKGLVPTAAVVDLLERKDEAVPAVPAD